jgi:hypothetical protein
MTRIVPLVRIVRVIAIAALICPCALCAGKTRWFVDMTGRKIEIPVAVTRVALLGGPTGQIAYILDARSQLCAVTKALKSSELVNLMDPSVKDLVAPRSTSGQVNVEELIVAIIKAREPARIHVSMQKMKGLSPLYEKFAFNRESGLRIRDRGIHVTFPGCS